MTFLLESKPVSSPVGLVLRFLGLDFSESTDTFSSSKDSDSYMIKKLYGYMSGNLLHHIHKRLEKFFYN